MVLVQHSLIVGWILYLNHWIFGYDGLKNNGQKKWNVSGA